MVEKVHRNIESEHPCAQARGRCAEEHRPERGAARRRGVPHRTREQPEPAGEHEAREERGAAVLHLRAARLGGMVTAPREVTTNSSRGFDSSRVCPIFYVLNQMGCGMVNSVAKP